MQAVLTDKELYHRRKQQIFDRITIRRSMLSNGRVRPEGYIFYNITMITFEKSKKGDGLKYTGTRMIDLSKEAKMGMDKIVANIKQELAAKHFEFVMNPEFETVEEDGVQ